MRTPTFTCASCDATGVDSPVFHLGLAFCCAGCAADGPCMCSYDTPGAESAGRVGAAVVAGDAAADADVLGIEGSVALVEPPALAAPTIAPAPAPTAAPARPRTAVPTAVPARSGGLVAPRRA